MGGREPQSGEGEKPRARREAGATGPLFLNRDLSWLEFNRRVLQEAVDHRTPLLERLRFLGIFSSNLDEFFMKRVGALHRRRAAGIDPTQLLGEIRRAVLPMLRQQADCFAREIRPALAREGVILSGWKELAPTRRRAADEFFRSRVFPVLTPLAVDPGHPFPFVSNLSTSLGVHLRHPERDENLFARVKIPRVMPQWIPLDPPRGRGGEVHFVSLQDLIAHNLDRVFPGMAILGVMPFRVTRNADVERDEEDVEDLLEAVAEELRERRFARAVRLEHGRCPDPLILRYFVEQLELTEADVYEMPGELDYTVFESVLALDRPELKYETWNPVAPPALADRDADIFAHIRSGDVLVHHPYESFSATVERFLSAAVDDPKVLAIKMTLYRTGPESPFIPLLIRAAEAAKQVVCVVELKARFDEEKNIATARSLETAGVHVVYGVVGLKTHAKVALVVRDEPDGVRSYVHVGTGNYNLQTARLYTDLGLMSCDPALAEDVVHLFNYLTGMSLHRDYRKLLVAPINMREGLLQRIEEEAELARAGQRARIVAKMNSLEDHDVGRALYDASAAGVRVDLVVRGFCCLRPRVPGLSENIRVFSVIGRFLEHSRIFHFSRGREDPLEGEFLIGSADWMYRNLLARVECVAPVESRPLRERLWEILATALEDRRQGWEMQPDGSYRRRSGGDDEPGTHRLLMQLAKSRGG